MSKEDDTLTGIGTGREFPLGRQPAFNLQRDPVGVAEPLDVVVGDVGSLPPGALELHVHLLFLLVENWFLGGHLRGGVRF